jgi:hypothetical protein
LHRLILALALAALGAFGVLFVGCQTTSKVTFVNPLDQPLYVTVNQRPSFEVPAHGTVRTNLPALERLQPMVITARDTHGAIVFALTMSFPRIQAAGSRIELRAPGHVYDPLQQPYPNTP